MVEGLPSGLVASARDGDEHQIKWQKEKWSLGE